MGDQRATTTVDVEEDSEADLRLRLIREALSRLEETAQQKLKNGTLFPTTSFYDLVTIMASNHCFSNLDKDDNDGGTQANVGLTIDEWQPRDRGHDKYKELANGNEKQEKDKASNYDGGTNNYNNSNVTFLKKKIKASHILQYLVRYLI